MSDLPPGLAPAPVPPPAADPPGYVVPGRDGLATGAFVMGILSLTCSPVRWHRAGTDRRRHGIRRSPRHPREWKRSKRCSARLVGNPHGRGGSDRERHLPHQCLGQHAPDAVRPPLTSARPMDRIRTIDWLYRWIAPSLTLIKR